MSRQKTARFADISKRDNVIEPGKEIFEKIKGNWHQLYFKNDKKITVELCCGRGEYTIGLGRRFPDENFIGIDLKGDRIWKGSGIAEEEHLTNVAFLRIHILELENLFEPGEVDDIWITFPDPRPKDRDIKRRITHTRYLDIYKKVLKPGGAIFFKTDNTGLFEYTLEELNNRDDIDDLVYTFDLYHSELKPECYDIRTRYEQKFSEQGHDIKYMRFKFSYLRSMTGVFRTSFRRISVFLVVWPPACCQASEGCNRRTYSADFFYRRNGYKQVRPKWGLCRSHFSLE